MIDAHCHPHDRRVTAPAEVLARARVAGVRGFVLAGVDPAGWSDAERIACAYTDVWLTLGVHPQVVAEVGEGAAQGMADALEEALAARGPRVVALGELGLDALVAAAETLPAQEALFVRQLRLAIALDLPLNLHVLRAHEQALSVLEREGVPARGGLVHSFGASPELAARYLALGLHLSFSGSVGWHAGSKAARSAGACPAERLLVETDAPDQTPAAHRPGPNEPAFLVDVVADLARIRGEDARTVADYTAENARRLFHLETEAP